MNIAVYQGFDIIHFEVLGYLIEYFIKSKININIYAHTNNLINIEWKNYYNTLFKTEMIWTNPYNFNPEIYDLIFLLTDDDFSFKEEWLIKYGNEKVIMIDHSGKIRRNNAYYRIGTRFFSNRPECAWALPIYTGILKKDKKKYLENINEINVMCIGIQNRPPSINFLKDLFTNFENIDFHIIARHLTKEIYENYENIKIYPFCNTILMFNLIKTTQYILCLENPDNPEPIANSMSGAIPKAFSYGCNLIIPSKWQHHYNFKSCIEYNDNLLQKNGQSNITLSNTIPLDLIYDEAYYYISHRNTLFDTILKNKLPKLFNKYFLSLPSPNILIVDTCTNEISDELCYQYREIHINSDISDFTEKSNCYIYNIIDYNKIQEPFIRIFENYDILDEIDCISKRIFRDIVIIKDNALPNINEIKNIYNKNKYCIYYTFENKIIIIPQK